MTRRLNGPFGACCAFLFVATLVIGGLGWVTHEALQVEESRLEANVRAERSNKERLALWRLDGQMLFALGLENNRPFAHYSALHTTYSAVEAGTDGPTLGVVRLPSPLLSNDLQPWMLLHFQIDPETGWESPQVLETEQQERLENPPFNWSTANCTDVRRNLLADLETKFPAHELLPSLAESEKAVANETPFVVPFPQLDEAATAKRAGNGLAFAGTALPPPSESPEFLAIERPIGRKHPASGVIPSIKTNFGKEPTRPGKTSPKPPPPSLPLPTAPAPIPSLTGSAFAQEPPRPVRGEPAGPQVPSVPTPAPSANVSAAPEPRPTTAMAAVPGAMPQQSVSRNTTSNSNSGWYSNKFLQNDLQQREDPSRLKEWTGRLQLAQRVFEGRGTYEAQSPAGKTPQSLYLNDRPAPDSRTDVKNDLGGSGGSFPNAGKVQAPFPIAPAEQDSSKQYALQIDRAREIAEQAKEACKKAPADSVEAKKLEKACDEFLAKLRTEGEAKGQKGGEGRPDAGAKAGSSNAADLKEKDLAGGLIRGQRQTETLDSFQELLDKLHKFEGLPKPGTGALPAFPSVPTIPIAAGLHKPAPGVRAVPVHVGPLRPRWLTAADGSEVLVLIRAATIDDKTVYQGILLDWPGLQKELGKNVSDLFPTGTLTPVRTPEDLVPERAMTALPVQLDPGPLPPPAPAGWTPLRMGLALAWAAALVALAAVWVGGFTLLKLSERRFRFVSAVTHELRTPLTSMRLYLDLLTSGMVQDEQKQKEYLTTLAAESARLNQLVENVLDFAKLEKRSVRACRQATPVADVVEQVRETWADRCAAEGKELVVIATVPAEQKVHTDLRIAGQILGNLVDNARKYARDAVDPRIWVWAKPGERGRIIFEVEDRGPGVPVRERGSIFRAFRRGKESNAHTGGTGLGLALAKQWADMLGGKLSYRPADGGVGACFRLELPAA